VPASTLIARPRVRERYVFDEACPFCVGQCSDGHWRERPVLESDLFVAWVSKGALVEGHLLVIPKAHVLNLRAMSPQMRSELPAFLASVAIQVEASYGPVCMFEHGPTRHGSTAGCSIDHAHMHVLPWAQSLIEAAQTDYRQFEWRPVTSLEGVLDEPATDPYLFVRDGDGEMALASHPDIPSQALRRTIAAGLGREEEWDWKTHPRSGTVQRTVRRLVGAAA
jgi:ATP adenylyltransferase